MTAPARLAVTVTPDAERHLRAGHPWVYDRSVLTARRTSGAEGEPASGDLAVVFDKHRRFLAIGLWDPASPLRIRVLHHGSPATVDATFWHDKLAAALAGRQPLVDDRSTTGYRWVHGEDDGLPGLVVDRYADVVVLKLYSAAWLPHLEAVAAAIEGLVLPDAIVLRLARAVQRAGHARKEGTVLRGALPSAIVPFLESGLSFAADVVDGQKTGWFLDQRDNRRRVAELAKGKDLLDVFCAGGGFTVHAAAGGARSVTSVDASAGAVDAVSANLARNHRQVSACLHEGIVGDAYDVMADLAKARRRFGVVVVDPPSFASKQEQAERALSAYGRLTELAVRLVVPGGVLVQASCSGRVSSDRFYSAVLGAARRAGVTLLELDRTAQPIDHPIARPESAYLKALFARVQPPSR